jgi:hypothetical protein
MTGFLRTAALGVALSVGVLGIAGVATAAPVNMVTNGDFSSGNTGFSSGYDFTPGIGIDPGVYTIGTDPAGWHPLWVSGGDHTSGNGNMFLGNGSTTLGQTVWQSQSINVEAGQNYFFEAFVANVCCTDFIRMNGPSLLNFTISFNGGPAISLGTRSTNPAVAGVWQGLSTEWLSTTAGSVILALTNGSDVYDGNDFAMDDVYFGTETSIDPVPEPATIALLLTGLPLAQAVRRRRAAARQKSLQAQA